MKVMKKIVGMVLLMALSLSLVACGGWSEEDAKGYVTGVLDSSYKEEFADYIKYTKKTEAEAKELYDENVQTVLDEANFASLGVNAEIEEELNNVLVAMMKKAEYKVVEAKKKDKDFEVTVSFKPFQMKIDEITSSLEEELYSRLDVDKISEQLLNGEITEDDIQQMGFQIYLEMLQENLESPTYGEEETMTLHVKLDDNNVYYVDEAELGELDSKMFVE
ncbi:hypothetical protein M2145_000483 [Lachnospiraceae bacterium PF1-21]|uniref:Lipoprotein n=1 Tax=Ohessyouella blattaphilus TaxID=2949333 RepID=A0ABT1EF32_9FIRM|nr:hypothetical protein [Ohessyouella blattaphilus]MCP1109099.1 hypothetical protein [Ohessyouella blattaphilus]MCR8562493.1 hypothetical protein [Ohessyouella blattaphilus]MDL2250304.1 hypothetical protein [Lachnospiraceae bacterium OttesenSCG-928-J05]